MYSYDARPWLVWLLCIVAACWLLLEAYELGRRSTRVMFVIAPVDTVALPPDTLICAQWRTVLWYDSLRIVETGLP